MYNFLLNMNKTLTVEVVTWRFVSKINHYSELLEVEKNSHIILQVFDCKLNQKDMHGESPYEIMFGPDICGPGTKKVSFCW